METIGLHLRLESLMDIARKAIRFGMPTFQSFLQTKKNVEFVISAADKQQFLALRRAHFTTTYLHAAYWINLCNRNSASLTAFNQEMALAKEFEFTHVIFHPGSFKAGAPRTSGIDAIAQTVNDAQKQYPDVTIVLENTAHGNRSIGSDLNDFALILEKIDKPDQIQFCIDTAHAYVYGYDIADSVGQADFIKKMDTTIGLERISLLHLNDTKETLGKRIDCHDAIGEGNVGDDALRSFVLHPRLNHVPIILELPVMDETKELAQLNKVRAWRQELMLNVSQLNDVKTSTISV